MSVFDAIGFVMTDKCSAECGICCFSCSPRNNTVLDKEVIKDYIRQAHELGGIRIIAFTGGEAIMYFEQLRECMACAHEFGMKTTLVTNGFWARDVQRGIEMMRELAASGLSKVSFSVDSYHQEYVSYETVASAVKICERLGIAQDIAIMEVADGHNLREVMDNLRGELYNKEITVYPLLAVGAAAENISDDQIIRECVAEDASCPFIKCISFFYDGTIQICCSQFSKEISMVRLGTFGKTSLNDAISAFHDNDFIYVLFKRYFKWYVEAAKNNGIPVAEKYSTPCELCHYLFTNKGFVETLRPLVKKEADRLRIEKLFQ